MAIQKIKLDATMQEAIALINSNFNFLLGQSGTWTPVLKNCTYTLTTNSCSYYRIGNLCYIRLYLRGTIKTIQGGGQALIGGLPFIIKNRSDFALGMLGRCVVKATSPCVGGQNDYIGFYYGDGSTSAGSNTCIWKTGDEDFYMSFSGVYEIGE